MRTKTETSPTFRIDRYETNAVGARTQVETIYLRQAARNAHSVYGKLHHGKGENLDRAGLDRVLAGEQGPVLAKLCAKAVELAEGGADDFAAGKALLELHDELEPRPAYVPPVRETACHHGVSFADDCADCELD